MGKTPNQIPAHAEGAFVVITVNTPSDLAYFNQFHSDQLVVGKRIFLRGDGTARICSYRLFCRTFPLSCFKD
jgi:hypothetical protein